MNYALIAPFLERKLFQPSGKLTLLVLFFLAFLPQVLKQLLFTRLSYRSFNVGCEYFVVYRDNQSDKPVKPVFDDLRASCYLSPL